uniref:Uncharacterized protein n=1 Tax=Vitis vinifera TaxID=29760 RepID=F6HN15_VITVI
MTVGLVTKWMSEEIP